MPEMLELMTEIELIYFGKLEQCVVHKVGKWEFPKILFEFLNKINLM